LFGYRQQQQQQQQQRDFVQTTLFFLLITFFLRFRFGFLNVVSINSASVNVSLAKVGCDNRAKSYKT
jgi:hypothetical protein